MININAFFNQVLPMATCDSLAGPRAVTMFLSSAPELTVLAGGVCSEGKSPLYVSLQTQVSGVKE
jgi:hypothetical protein